MTTCLARGMRSKWNAPLALVALCAWPGSALAQNGDPGPGETVRPADAAAPTNDTPDDRHVSSGTTQTEATPPAPRHHRRHHAESTSGRDFDLLWVGAEVGAAIVDLKMISYDQLLPSEINVRETGLGFGAVAGIKVKFLSVGLHLAVGKLSEFDVWALNLDGQLRIPLDFLEPYVRLGIGYAFLGAFSGQTDMKDVTVDGWDLQAGFGMDLYPSDFFSLGAGADFTVLNLSRTASPTSVDLTQDGAAVGVAVFLQAKAALHF